MIGLIGSLFAVFFIVFSMLLPLPRLRIATVLAARAPYPYRMFVFHFVRSLYFLWCLTVLLWLCSLVSYVFPWFTLWPL